MTLPVTQRTDTLDTWRQNLNTIGSNTGDPVNIYVSDGTDSYTQPATGIIVATLNDLNTRKVKRSGDTISYLNVSTTLHVSGTTTLASLSTTSIAASSSISGASLSVTGQITSTVATGTAPFVVSSTTPVANLSIGGNAGTATSSTNLLGGALGSVPYQSGSGVTSFLNIGSANQLLTINGSANGLAYRSLTSNGGTISFTYTASGINLEASAVTGSTTFTGNITTVNGSTTTFEVSATTGNTWVGGIFQLGGTNSSGTISGTTFSIATNGNVTSSGTITSAGLNISGSSSISSTTLTGTTSFNSLTDVVTGTLTTTSTTANQVIQNLAIATYRSVEYIIQGVDSTGSKYHSSTIKAIHDGTNVSFTEYASAATANGLTGTFNVAISAGNLQLQVTPASANSTVFKVYAIATRI